MRPLDPQRREIAIEVLMATKMVQNWVDGQLKFLQVSLNDSNYRNIRLRLARQQATKIIDER